MNIPHELIWTRITGDFTGLGMAGSTLYSFDSVTDRLHAISTTTGATVGATIDMGLNNQGTIVFTSASLDLISGLTYD